MAEYIDKKQAIDRIASCYCMDCEHSNGILCRACEHQDDMDLIDDMPAVDVQPVKRGKWLHFNSDGIIFCSECKHEAYWDTDYGQQLFDYCPYCGARMIKDGDTDA